MFTSIVSAVVPLIFLSATLSWTSTKQSLSNLYVADFNINKSSVIDFLNPTKSYILNKCHENSTFYGSSIFGFRGAVLFNSCLFWNYFNRDVPFKCHFVKSAKRSEGIYSISVTW